jgi:hypothetical protein
MHCERILVDMYSCLQQRGVVKRRHIKRAVPHTPCGYCFQRWATVWDHLIPVSHGGTNNSINLYPVCDRCNALASNLVFDTLELKRGYIRNELIKRGEWNLPAVPQDLSNETEVATLLQTEMPMAALVKPTPARIIKKRRCRRCKCLLSGLRSVWCSRMCERAYHAAIRARNRAATKARFLVVVAARRAPLFKL